MRRTPEEECRHAINLHDCRTKVAETLAELAGKLNEEEKRDSFAVKIINYFERGLSIGSFARDV